MRTMFVLGIVSFAVACGPAPGACEVEYSADGTLCYEIGFENNKGYPEKECVRNADKGFSWTGESTCGDLGYSIVCSEEDGYYVLGDTQTTCDSFNGLLSSTTPTGE